MLSHIRILFDAGTIRLAGLAFCIGGLVVHGEEISASQESDSLTLEDAISRTLERNPLLAVRHLEIKARDARSIQAGKISNPEVFLEGENFAGTGPLAGIEGLETTVSLNQLLELGGKRAGRKRLAGAEKELADWDLKASQVGLLAEVRTAFTEVLAAQERLRILQGGLEVFQQILETAKLRHTAGKAPATEAMKARMAYSLNHIEIDRATQDLRSARNRLALFWSTEPPGFKGARGDLRSTPVLPSLGELLARLAAHPELARWKTEVAKRQLLIQVTRAGKIPDLSLEAGVRHLNTDGDVALVAGVSMPLPILNRNQGSIQEAGYRLDQAEKERQDVEAHLSSRLRTLHETLQARSEEISHLKDELLPESEKTLHASREAYRLGKLSFLEVLDSQRTLYELGTRFISTLADYHKDWIELESLVSSGGGKNP